VPPHRDLRGGVLKSSTMAFAFFLPACSPGDRVKVPAPDGVELHIPVPDTALPGDKMYMGKNESGVWSITRVTRGEVKGGAPAVAVPSAPAPIQWRSNADLARDMSGSGSVSVCLETTKGRICMTLVPSWAPEGVKRFLELVDDGFYSEIAVYRVVPNFLAQFGIAKHAQTTYDKIADDPLIGIPIQEGSICFAASGPNTRKNQICLWLGDFPSFGKSPWETPIGKVSVESLPVMHGLYTGYGDIPQCGGKGPDPRQLEELGNDYIASGFPQVDFITSASRM